MSGGRTAKLDPAKLISVTSRPAAVIPWTDDEEVLFRGIVTLEQLVNLYRAVEILLVPPSGYVQDRHGDAVEPRRKTLAFPECGVVGFFDKVGPGRNLAVKVLLIHIRKRTKI